jgi:hypothetical protein
MKYMIMMFGAATAAAEARPPEWIKNMQQFMGGLDTELKEAGEVVASHGLVDPSRATTIRFSGGVPVPTDGPYAEVKESLVGFWILDVSQERALEVAAQVVAVIEQPIEVRPVMR